MFSHDGREVVGTYNDDDVYMFSTEKSDSANYIHRYQGHRNNATGKKKLNYKKAIKIVFDP